MKNIFKKIVSAVIQWEARIILRKYKPKIVAVAGSVGKTSTKDALYTALSQGFSVRKSNKSFNSDIGVPLTILDLPNAWSNPFLWIGNMLKGLGMILFPVKYPEWLVLEVGADQPRDIELLMRWLTPDIAVLTRFPAIPVHVEFFDSPEAVLAEDALVARGLPQHGLFLANSDDSAILKIKEELRRTAMTYGFDGGADVRATHNEIFYEERDEARNEKRDGNDGRKVPAGMRFNIEYGGNSFPAEIRGALGRSHIYPILAAFAVGISQGLTEVPLIKAFRKHETPPGRMKILEGIKGSVIIDDTYNSSPVAVEEAMATLQNIPTPPGAKKIAIMGDMLELGKYSTDLHKQAGELIAQSCNVLVTVGVRARYFAEGALNAEMDEKNIYQYDDPQLAGKFVESLISFGAGDIILAKGSQSIRVEKAVEEIMQHPENKEMLLVRQEPAWLARPVIPGI